MEHQTLDPPENQTEDQRAQPLLERGLHLLRMLQHAARAARLEAQVVELEAALEKAREGELRTLQLWLDEFERPAHAPVVRDPEIAPVVSHARGHLCNTPGSDQVPVERCEDLHSTEVEARKAQSQLATEILDDREDGAAGDWSDYLQHARQRLAERKASIGSRLPWLDTFEECEEATGQVFIVRRAQSEASSVALDDELAQDHSSVLAATESNATTLSTELCPESCPEPSAHAFVEKTCSEVLTFAEPVDEEDRPVDELSETSLQQLGLDRVHLASSELASAMQAAPNNKRWFRSYGLSVVGHAVALGILGTITYQAPTEGNSLGSQVLSAVESHHDSDLTSEVEMTEPSDMELADPIAEPAASKSVAGELSQLSQAVSPIAVDASANPVGSTIASAIAQATGKSNSGSRGSGAPSMSGKFFGVGTGGNYFCYVVDSSGSMRGAAWESAKSELMRSLKSLKPTQKFYIVFFADEFKAVAEPGSDQPATTGLYATPSNIEHARRWIGSVELSRGGPPNEALAWAIDREPDAIYLLTDGVTKVDICGYLRKTNRIEDIVSGPQVRVPIHAIAYFSLEGQQLMRQLAKENQGQFIYVPKPKK